MSYHNLFDRQPVALNDRYYFLDVIARIDDDRLFRMLIADYGAVALQPPDWKNLVNHATKLSRSKGDAVHELRLSRGLFCSKLRLPFGDDSSQHPTAITGQERLMERLRFVTHRAQRVLLLDFTHCTPEEISAISDQVPGVVTREPRGSVLVVADFSGAEFDREAVEHIKIATAFDRAHVKRAAWVLTENLPKVLYDSVRQFSAREFTVFATREEALDSVVSDE